MEQNPNVLLLDLPTKIYSFIRENADGSYTIVLNARLSAEDRERHYEHEIEHIKMRDFESDMTADEIEYLRHKKISRTAADSGDFRG